MEIPGIFPPSAANSFRMIDIGEKKDTIRRAVASGIFFAKQETITRIREKTLPKGDALSLCEVAGIQGAKLTSNILPLCHPLSLSSIKLWTQIGLDQIQVFCEVKSIGKTGVEMEALCGVNAALLCLYDLSKGIDPVLQIGNIHLELKEGGKSSQQQDLNLSGIKACVITLSDRCSRNETQDLSGPTALTWLQSQGAQTSDILLLPDEFDRLKGELRHLLTHQEFQFIITNGGTGVSKRDITPDAISSLSQELSGKEIPGFGELLRASGALFTSKSWLSRSSAYLICNTLVLCLPGNPRAVKEGLESVGHLIGHCLHVASGGKHP